MPQTEPMTPEERRIKKHFDFIRDALESITDPECTRFMRRVKADQATISIDQLYLDWRNNRLGMDGAQRDRELLTKAAERVCEKCFHKNLGCNGHCSITNAILAPLDEKEGS